MLLFFLLNTGTCLWQGDLFYSAQPTQEPCVSHSQHRKNQERFRKKCRKRYIVERTNKTEIRLGEQSEKAELCREDLWTEIQVKGS